MPPVRGDGMLVAAPERVPSGVGSLQGKRGAMQRVSDAPATAKRGTTVGQERSAAVNWRQWRPQVRFQRDTDPLGPFVEGAAPLNLAGHGPITGIAVHDTPRRKVPRGGEVNQVKPVVSAQAKTGHEECERQQEHPLARTVEVCVPLDMDQAAHRGLEGAGQAVIGLDQEQRRCTHAAGACGGSARIIGIHGGGALSARD